MNQIHAFKTTATTKVISNGNNNNREREDNTDCIATEQCQYVILNVVFLFGKLSIFNSPVTMLF